MDYSSIEHLAQHLQEGVENGMESGSMASEIRLSLGEWLAENRRTIGSQPVTEKSDSKVAPPNPKRMGIILAVLAAIGLLGGIITTIVGLVVFLF